MTLRLVLVSLVAALGLTLPGGQAIENWVASTQRWMNAKFADWDQATSRDGDYVILPEPGFLLCNRAPGVELKGPGAIVERDLPGLAIACQETRREGSGGGNAPSRAVASWEPVEVWDLVLPDVAMELNRANEGIGITPPPLAKTESPLVVAFEPMEIAEEGPQGIVDRLNREHEGIGITPPPVLRTQLAAQVSVEGEEHPWLRIVAAEASWEPAEGALGDGGAAPIADVAGSVEGNVVGKGLGLGMAGDETAASESGLDLPGQVAMSVSDALFQGLAEALVVAERSLPEPPAAPLATDLEARGEVAFEPMDLPEELETGIAFELNRRNDGIGLSWPREGSSAGQLGSVAGVREDRDFDRAVRLTRDALFAWVHVFTGPPLVTASKP